MPPLQSKKTKSSPRVRAHPFNSSDKSSSASNSKTATYTSSKAAFGTAIPPPKGSNERQWVDAWRFLGSQAILPLGPLWIACVNDAPHTLKSSIDQKVTLRRSLLQSSQMMRHIGEYMQSTGGFTSECQLAMWNRFREERKLLDSSRWKDKIVRVLSNSNGWASPVWKGALFPDQAQSFFAEGFTLENQPIPMLYEAKKIVF